MSATELKSGDQIPLLGKSQNLDASFSSTELLQKGLLGLSVVCALISVAAPGLGMGGALALRSVAVLSAGTEWARAEGKGEFALRTLRLGLVLLGLIGVATNQTPLVISSLALDLLFRIVETGRSLRQKDRSQALCEASLLIVNAMALAAMVTGDWRVLTSAAVVSTVVMAGFGAKAFVKARKERSKGSLFEAICYAALSILSAISAVQVATPRAHLEKHLYRVTNDDPFHRLLRVYDKNSQVFRHVYPGQTVEFTIDPRTEFVYYHYWNDVSRSLYPAQILYEPIYLPHSQFAWVPVGGPALCLDGSKNKNRTQF